MCLYVFIYKYLNLYLSYFDHLLNSCLIKIYDNKGAEEMT